MEAKEAADIDKAFRFKVYVVHITFFLVAIPSISESMNPIT